MAPTREKTTRAIALDAAEYFGFLAEGKRSCNVTDLMAAADYAGPVRAATRAGGRNRGRVCHGWR